MCGEFGSDNWWCSRATSDSVSGVTPGSAGVRGNICGDIELGSAEVFEAKPPIPYITSLAKCLVFSFLNRFNFYKCEVKSYPHFY